MTSTLISNLFCFMIRMYMLSFIRDIEVSRKAYAYAYYLLINTNICQSCVFAMKALVEI